MKIAFTLSITELAAMTNLKTHSILSRGRVYAHSLKGQPEEKWELLSEHSRNVAEAARSRASLFGAGDLAACVGLLHDIGKIKPLFQARLRDPNVREPHAAEGARSANALGALGRLGAFAIAGHHGAMPNALGKSGLNGRIAAAQQIAIPPWASVVAPTVPAILNVGGLSRNAQAFRLQLLTRMLFSCLVGADERETERFYAEAGQRAPRREARLLDPQSLLAAFDQYVAALPTGGPANALRRDVLDHARRAASSDRGLFSLTVPTGGGKTLTSLAFALEHARVHGLRRVIYVIPFTSIVEQTAAVFRNVFENALAPDDILEHYASFDVAHDVKDDDEARDRRRSAESWDAPIVVTTAVQFFESLFSNRKRRCRKLHAIANSVVILDEAQTLPLKLMRPCLAALRELGDAYGVSAVLCTATQPGVRKEDGFPAEEALDGVREIAPDPPHLYRTLKRCEARDIGDQSDQAVGARMRTARSVLTIVDNRTQARRIFDAIADVDGARHLSTFMTAEHRRAVLSDVRRRLDAGESVRLVATSLIEAGVDVDFPVVMRSASGIDRIAQAAGRCNREGRLAMGEVLVFNPTDHSRPPEVEGFAEVGADIVKRHADALSLEAVRSYFQELYRRYGADKLDCVEVAGTPGVLNAIAAAGKELDFAFEDIAAAVRFIEDGQNAVIVRGGRWGIGEDALDALAERPPGVVAQAVQRYTVNVNHAMWNALRAAGAVTWWRPERFDEQFPVLEASGGRLYDDAAGLTVDHPDDMGFLLG